MNKGIVILAENTDTVNYVECAEVLAKSIKRTMPTMDITLITNNTTNLSLWDKVIPLPYGDLCIGSDWKLKNDWQVYDASPYEYTIKLEADLYIPYSIEYWFDILKSKDVVICTHIRDFKQELSDVKVYRKFIYDNNLPDTYNAITYFKKSTLAEKFFKVVKDIFDNWEQYKQVIKCNPNEIATTDFVYAIASHIIGVEHTTMPNFTAMSMVHMKPFIQEIGNDWTKTLIYELFPDLIKINTYPQMYPFHYVTKSFAKELNKVL